MASPAIENMRKAFEAFTRGDTETVSRFIDPELTVDDRVLPEPNPTERGIGALIANTNNDLGQVITLKDGRAVKLDVFRIWEEAKAHVGYEE